MLRHVNYCSNKRNFFPAKPVSGRGGRASWLCLFHGVTSLSKFEYSAFHCRPPQNCVNPVYALRKAVLPGRIRHHRAG